VIETYWSATKATYAVSARFFRCITQENIGFGVVMVVVQRVVTIIGSHYVGLRKRVKLLPNGKQALMLALAGV
jgi:hypothetical protein